MSNLNYRLPSTAIKQYGNETHYMETKRTNANLVDSREFQITVYGER